MTDVCSAVGLILTAPSSTTYLDLPSSMAIATPVATLTLASSNNESLHLLWRRSARTSTVRGTGIRSSGRPSVRPHGDRETERPPQPGCCLGGHRRGVGRLHAPERGREPRSDGALDGRLRA